MTAAAPLSAQSLDTKPSTVDPYFHTWMQLLSGGIPIKVAKETLKWIRTVTFVSKEQLDRFEDMSGMLRSMSKAHTQIALIPDGLSLIESISNLPQKITNALDGLGEGGFSCLSALTNCAKVILFDILGPFFKSVGFFITDLADLKFIDMGCSSELFKMGLGSLLLFMSVSDISKCIFKYTVAKTDEEIRGATLRLLEKGTDLAINAIYFTSIGSMPTLAITLLLLSTTKLLAKTISEYLKKEKDALSDQKMTNHSTMSPPPPLSQIT